ncbi:MAG: TRAP transporter fused permease subunit [Chloroflexi bacterium]|nr:TRAP transporter fused permease subunit [Chloroflexota bacterium]
MRKNNKILNTSTRVLCAATGVYYLYVFVSGTITPMRTMAPILMTGLIMAFLTRPLSERLPYKIVLALDLLLTALTIFVIGYLLSIEANMEVLWVQPTGITWFVGTAILVLILEATRRLIGWSLVIIVLVFILYGLYGNYAPGALWHGGLKWGTLIFTVSLSTEGIWGIPVRVIAQIVVIFMLFSAFLSVSGASDLFLNLAQSAFGRFRGGPAKMAVIASSLFGTISGSGVANVVATGTVTIPLMKNTGYPSHIAATVEALASTGGQIMPPIMGATAFVMAEFLGVSYWTIVKAAFLPALLYYISIFVFVDFEAGKLGLKGLSREEIPRMKPVLLKSGHVLLPLVLLVVALGVFDLSVATAALYSLAGLFVISFVNKSTWITPRKFYRALVEGIQSMSGVTVACGSAAILMGLVAATNLGMALSGILISISQGILPILLVLTAIAGLILGMGMTTTAVYIFLAILIAPAMEQMGVPPLAAHLFILYYGVLNLITPPFCLASFAAAGIAGAPPMKVGWTATFRGIILYIVPFMFVYDQALILQGSPLDVITAFVTSVIGVCGLVAAIEGYVFIGRAEAVLHRALLGIGGAAMIVPGFVTDLIGIVLLSVGVVVAYSKVKRERIAREALRQ